MGAMAIPMRAVLPMALVLLCGSVVVAVFDGYNGLPRPAGMDQAPTTTYGAKPAVEYENKAAKCTWYGWENGNYPPEGTHNCSSSLWGSLSTADPASLSAYMYYVPLDNSYYDPLYNEYLCAVGCFDLTASGPAAGPVLSPTASPPAEVPTAATPPVDAAPPPKKTIAPPSPGVSAPRPVTLYWPPPSATLFRPPPPATPLPPSPTPTTIAEPPLESAPSPATSPESSPETSPLLSPEFSPIYSPGIVPGPTAGGPSSVEQRGSATATSAPTVLVFTAALFLCFNLLV